MPTSLATFLDDGPQGQVLADCYCFQNGTEDPDEPDGQYYFASEYDNAMASYLAAGLPFTVRFYPATPDPF